MHSRWRKASATALAAGVAAALTAGAVTPAGATTDQAARAKASGGAGVTALTAKGNTRTWITLITGDRVAVNAKGEPVGVERAKGREHIPFQVLRSAGHTYLIPQDATQLIRQDKVDRRLFDITTLSRAEYRRAQRQGLGFIVTYKGSAPKAKSELHGAAGTEVTHTFRKFGGEAVTARSSDAGNVWQALTNEPNEPGAAPYATAESGLGKVWLDAVQKAALDKSVPQIGAPSAWAAGYDGKGVKIAVLDTGVDKTHPDLAGKVTAEQDFSGSGHTTDGFGHGTHVASIAAGTGAKSGGKYKGVAPEAELLNGKVLDDSGFGDDSGIIAGLEWAAAQGAKVANLSLGGADTPGEDPIEQAVNKLSADTGTLFVIAAGNDGPGAGTVGSPGSADAALTVGAVDKSDQLADFSSRGPRVGDGAIKPDLTAPGVDITAAAAPGSVIDTAPGVPHPAPGYLTISGTSMATPHVAGAAAILAQEHPDWSGQQIKQALVSSTKAGAYNAFEGGSGRVDVAAAIKQTVVADPVSLSFGTAQWPHNDDPKITKTVTYHNTGAQDVTLALSVAATGPDGKAAPDGFFSLDKQQLTVPAGGKAEASVTVDSTLGGTLDGAYSAFLTATGGGQTVRTAAAVNREVESYDVTLKHLGRDGLPTKAYGTFLEGLSGLAKDQFLMPYDESGTVTVRVPKGRYVLSSSVYVGSGETFEGADWINQPKLDVTKNTSVTIDARTAKPVDLTVPDSRAAQQFASIDFTVDIGSYATSYGWWLESYKNFRTGSLGPAVPARELHQQVQGVWTRGTTTEYDLAYGGHLTRLPAGFVKHAKQRDLAKINARLGASVKNKDGYLQAWPDTGGSGASSYGVPHKLPYTRTTYVNGGSGVKWSFDFTQQSADLGGDAGYATDNRSYTGGRTYEQVFNTGVFGPKLGKGLGIFRQGNQIYGYLPLFADGKGHLGSSLYTAVKTTLYRNGHAVGSNTDPVTGEPFTVPAGNAEYKLTTTVTRNKVASVSTKVSATWTFSSKRVSGNEVALPASAVRFSPALSLTSTSKARATVKVPVSVQGSAAGRNLKYLKVYVSFDGGSHWTKLTVRQGKVTVKNPKAGKGVSFKALVGDKKGDTLSQTITNAYITK